LAYIEERTFLIIHLERIEKRYFHIKTLGFPDI